jgi:5'-nucleotidase
MAATPPGTSSTVQLIGLADLTGHLEPSGTGRLRSGQAVSTGGMARLAAFVRRAERAEPGTLVLSAGDNVGAGPLVSSLFGDRPTIAALNLLGLDASALGNHELDEGQDAFGRLRRRATFPYLAANLDRTRTGRPLLPAYTIRRAGPVRVGIVGAVTRQLPRFVTASQFAGLRVEREAAAINRAVAAVGRRGVDTVVVVINRAGPDPFGGSCAGGRGELFDIVRGLSPRVGVIFAANAGAPFVCRVDGRVVASGASRGRAVARMTMKVAPDGALRDVRAQIVPVTGRLGVDPAMAALVRRAVARAAPVAERVVGRLTAPADRVPAAGGQSRLGALVADAQLAATSPPAAGGARIALTNLDGLAADLPAGPVRYARLASAQPFRDRLVTMTLTGAQVGRLLEQQFDNPRAGERRILQVSDGLAYTWDPDAPAGRRVVAGSLTLGGVPIQPARGYRVTVNTYLASGGGGFTVLRAGRERRDGDKDIEALAAFIRAGSPLTPPDPAGRVRRVG